MPKFMDRVATAKRLAPAKIPQGPQPVPRGCPMPAGADIQADRWAYHGTLIALGPTGPRTWGSRAGCPLSRASGHYARACAPAREPSRRFRFDYENS